MFANLALQKILINPDIKTVLDVGCGDGTHSLAFAKAGKHVYACDIRRHHNLQHDNIDFLYMDFNDGPIINQVDCVWTSHVLEHQLNVNNFLTRALSYLKPGYPIVITVPPMKHDIVGGHLSVWNAGLVLYNLILAGTSCKSAMIKTYGYNISVIVRHEPIILPRLRFDCGDIETLKDFFPPNMAYQGFNGDVKEYNWN